MAKALKSAICAAILAACDIGNQESDESRQDFLRRCVRGVNKLDDKAYEKLNDDVVKWFNAAADVVDANKKADKPADLPDFPDVEKDEEEQTSSRRRRPADDDAPKKEKGEGLNPDTVKVGIYVTVVTKRGKEYKNAKVVEVDKKEDLIVIDGPDTDGELEVTWDRIGTIEIFNDGAKKDSEPEGPAEPKVGDTVKIKTKRGREVEGELLEIDDETIVMRTGEGEEDFGRSRIDDIKVVKAAGGKASTSKSESSKDEGTSTRRRGSSDSKDDDKGGKGKDAEGETKRPRASNGGVSVSQTISNLILDNMDASEEDIAKLLKKAGVEARENTVHLNYDATHKLLKLLKERKMLKG